MSKNLSSLSGRKGLEGNLFEKIGNLSAETGTPDRKALTQLAEEYLMGPANLFGTATFYDFTRPENQGKKVYVCNGSSCNLAGTQQKVRQALEEHFETDEIGEMCCLGRCHENAAFHLDGQNYSGNAIQDIAGLAQKNLAFSPDNYAVDSLGDPLLTHTFPDLNEARGLVQKLLSVSPGSVLSEIAASGLRGRGGAGFPISIKMETCREASGTRKFVVCNADEGDPGSFSDRYLLEHRPLALLTGMMTAGYAIGASYGVLYVRAEYPESINMMEKTVADLYAAGLAGEEILGSSFSFHFKLIKAQGAYICGEETALLASIEGQRPEVRVRPPFPAQEGLFRQPTLVNNVETLANLAHILHTGGAAYAARGTGRSAGTKLLSLDAAFQKPGVYEVEMGTPLKDVIERAGGGFARPVKALHIGGPLGGLVPVSKIDDLTVDFESFSENGFLLGHGSIIGVPDDYPMIQYIGHLFEFTAHESCGKCFPCRLGSTRGKEMCTKAAAGDYLIDQTLLDDLLFTLEQGSLCGLGGGIPLPVRNALQYFREELTPYFQTEKTAQ